VVGNPLTVNAGFNIWTTGDAKGVLSAFGYSQDLALTVLEGAISLTTLSVAATALIALSF